ncbi:hypothetical protein CANINC_003855 [Pichia inconspicua]|uniref:Uncharacterized protein n=1 Tax=Pichia inconspicua TaxID=52247 RepID=A0A4T0WXM7_9ASCO|nr:hypothetical protein CANINC_003855 [[Candida] inconspicua]
MAIKRLSKAVSAGIVSTSSIRSQISVLKELIENAVDAILESCGSNNNIGQIQIEIDKETAGLEYLSVSDDGPGIQKGDRNLLCLNHTTSKIYSKDEFFNGISTCGFRGEALNFIAGLSQRMEISTKTYTDEMVECWTVGSSGVPNSDSKFVPGVIGTTIKLNTIFQSTPVRYKFLKKSKQKILKDIESLVMTFALIYRSIRFQLKYVKVLPGNRIQSVDIKTYASKVDRIQLISSIFNFGKQEQFFESKLNFKVGSVGYALYDAQVDLILPYVKVDSTFASKINLKIATVNCKPMSLRLKFGKTVASKVSETYSSLLLPIPTTWYVSFNLPADVVDFNIEPEKSDILIPNEEEFFNNFVENLTCIITEKNGLKKSEITITDKTKIHDEVVNFGVDFNLSSDEDLFESLETSFERLKKNQEKELVDKKQLINETQLINGKQFADEKPNHLQTSNIKLEPEKNLSKDFKKQYKVDAVVARTEDDNEWSRSVYDDDTMLSSDIEIPQKSISQGNLVLTKEKSSELNPWTMMELSKEIKESIKDSSSITTKKTNAILTKDPELTLIEPEFNSPSDLQKSSKNRKSLKQMSISSYGTYQIKENLKNPITKTYSKIRLSEMSQNTLNNNLPAGFKLDINKTHRMARLNEEEIWTCRQGIPSKHLEQFVSQLYTALYYEPMCREPILNEDGIYSAI